MRGVAIGCALVAVAVSCCVTVNLGSFWQDEGREIQLCLAVKDFYAANHRAPASIAELPAPHGGWTTTSDGAPYRYECHDESGVPSCGLGWTEDGVSYGRNCGRLDRREATDYF